MIEKKTEKAKPELKEQIDLENQFILRLPEEPAKVLSEALQTGNFKDRMTIKLDNDLRYGEVRLDNWQFYAKVVDLPTVIECLKTIDTKSFYKSADICQVMICKDEPDEEPEKESPNKAKKKDPNKVDKKYLWPHGMTPPCKNVRKRRFRKTLKKKNVDAPEIEKEVKRLLRIDNDAVKVEFDIINEDIDKRSIDHSIKEDDAEFNDETMNEGDKSLNVLTTQKNNDSIGSDVDEDDATRNATSIGGVGEHDIFGEEVSSSDDDDERNDDTSRLSADDTRISSYSMSGPSGSGAIGNTTNTADDSMRDNLFSKSMFGSPKRDFDELGGSSSNLAAPSIYFEEQRRLTYNDEDFAFETQPQIQGQSQEHIKMKLSELYRQLDDLKMQKLQKGQEYSSIENPTLRQRMQDTLENLSRQITMKTKELSDYENMWGIKH